MYAILGIAVLGVLAYALWIFPWLTRYYVPHVDSESVSSGERVVVVSDVHIGSGAEDLLGLLYAVVSLRPDVMVIAGDLFDDERRRITESELGLLIRPLVERVELFGVSRMFYVLSRSSHDPKIDANRMELSFGRIRVIVVNGVLRLKIGRTIVNITHGDFACRNGFLAALLERVADVVGVKFLMERVLRRVLRISREDWLVMGHVHRAGIDEGRKVANAGSWKSYLGRPSHKAIVLITEEGIRLLDFERCRGGQF